LVSYSLTKINFFFNILHSVHYSSIITARETNAHNFIKITVLRHNSSCMFWAILVHHQGAQSCVEHLLNLLKPTGYVMHQQV